MFKCICLACGDDFETDIEFQDYCCEQCEMDRELGNDDQKLENRDMED